VELYTPVVATDARVGVPQGRGASGPELPFRPPVQGLLEASRPAAARALPRRNPPPPSRPPPPARARQVDAALGLLREALAAEVALQGELAAIQGALEPILAAGLAAAPGGGSGGAPRG
jgi:hypothetical protein